jgi:hypothetical protein
VISCVANSCCRRRYGDDSLHSGQLGYLLTLTCSTCGWWRWPWSGHSHRRAAGHSDCPP